MKNKVVVVIPIYKKKLSESEQLSLERCRKTIIFVAPQDFQSDYTQENKIIYFPKHYFEGIEGYNALMLSPIFYEKFLEYEYMLLYQLDAFVFRDELLEWCQKDVDYAGAAWIHHHKSWWKSLKNSIRAKIYVYRLRKKQNAQSDLKLGFITYKKVGNGGFSLRKIDNIIKILYLYPNWIQKIIASKIPEDVFLSVLVNLYQPNQLKILPFYQGIQFAFEMFPSYAYKINNYQLPFGCHDFEDWEPSFWKDNQFI
ncbi:MAG: hypothetical protein EAY69_04420 [Cytophagales bacterium]|nr:MAG: hypothetical protein EAY69_04420 [Cytophagales bacterium]